ncbi:MAG: 23S rRNA (pseudouridine(1915)-N(3))-methyltransferase RlmH [Clostridia bacterium]|nr:23S rRNA (pseudouridine(1915)-N(3))-methyltransferase RlmH [Clostridia bacterium]
MYNINLICVGKLKEDYLRAACAEYSKRLSAFCKLKITELTPARIPENPSAAQIDAALNDEGKRILACIAPNERVYAMCIEGKILSSEELSAEMQKAGVSGSGNIAFIIGGSHGLSDEVKCRANFKLSMSKMTFPHQLARVMLLEQVYRGFMISSGGKYHK